MNSRQPAEILSQDQNGSHLECRYSSSNTLLKQYNQENDLPSWCMWRTPAIQPKAYGTVLKEARRSHGPTRKSVVSSCRRANALSHWSFKSPVDAKRAVSGHLLRADTLPGH